MASQVEGSDIVMSKAKRRNLAKAQRKAAAAAQVSNPPTSGSSILPFNPPLYQIHISLG
jgi:hypothetical protein